MDDVEMKPHDVRVGQMVRVTGGPLVGFLGEVTNCSERTVRLVIQICGRAARVDLAHSDLQAVPDSEA